MRLLAVGDIHIRATGPRNRKDDYLKACIEKLYECWAIAEREKVDAIVQTGDVFHSPEVSITTLLDVAEVFMGAPVPLFCTIGNHDVPGYNPETIRRTSLNLLQRVTDFSLLVAKGSWILDGGKLGVFFQPYTSKNDVDGFGYQVPDDCRILVTHSMLLDHDLPYEAKHTNLYKLNTNAEIIISGHDHLGYGVIKRADGKLFVNPGALMRLSASEGEMRRTIQVAVIDTDTKTAKLIPLACAKPGEEVLDRSAIVEEAERRYAMDEFSALVNAGGKNTYISVEEIVNRIAADENLPPAVVDKALELVKGA